MSSRVVSNARREASDALLTPAHARDVAARSPSSDGPSATWAGVVMASESYRDWGSKARGDSLRLPGSAPMPSERWPSWAPKSSSMRRGWRRSPRWSGTGRRAHLLLYAEHLHQTRARARYRLREHHHLRLELLAIGSTPVVDINVPYGALPADTVRP